MILTYYFPLQVPLIGATIEPLDQITPRKWEIDTFKRTNLIYFIQSATTTLQSLIQLLEGIDYIVINDEVGAAIRTSYQHIQIAKQLLASNDLDEAVTHAKIAHQSAEKAFFDPSMLALLYFPGEQKYAIYIPLFLPIMIPVIFSLNSLKKHFKKRKRDDQDASEAKQNE
jgi:phosphatidylinositol glycan class S